MSALPSTSSPTPDTVLEMRQVVTRFGSHVVHSGVSLAVRRAEIFAVIGGSGSAKSTLLREMILLQQPSEGSVRVLGVELADITDAAALALRPESGGCRRIEPRVRSGLQ